MPDKTEKNIQEEFMEQIIEEYGIAMVLLLVGVAVVCGFSMLFQVM